MIVMAILVFVKTNSARSGAADGKVLAVFRLVDRTPLRLSQKVDDIANRVKYNIVVLL